ncbi:MAG: class I SAM-dependent methyltransferase [Oligoflexia bacterium]|nr:class I SAM-dependent methyltransferase [Oligoflexia bacterium]
MTQWPKKIPVLTEEQTRIRHDFMKLWHEVLPTKYSFIEKVNQKFAMMRKPNPNVMTRTLEIGAGLGSHIAYEDLTNQEYFINDIRANFMETALKRYPQLKSVVGDVQVGLNLPDGYFDRIIAIHVLEHMPDLPKALIEMKRLLKPGGYISAVIPCEGGLAYQLAREISAKRIFEKTYNTSYDWFIKTEHVSTAAEIFSELKKDFEIERSSYFPLMIPVITANLVIGLTCKVK